MPEIEITSWEVRTYGIYARAASKRVRKYRTKALPMLYFVCFIHAEIFPFKSFIDKISTEWKSLPKIRKRCSVINPKWTVLKNQCIWQRLTARNSQKISFKENVYLIISQSLRCIRFVAFSLFLQLFTASFQAFPGLFKFSAFNDASRVFLLLEMSIKTRNKSPKTWLQRELQAD